MIFHRRHIHQQSVCNSFSADFPALFCWIEFWCVFWEVPNLESFLVVFQKLLNVCAFMSTRSINNQKYFMPSFQKLVAKFQKSFLVFFRREHKHKSTFASCAKYICVFVCMVDNSNGFTSFSCPAS